MMSMLIFQPYSFAKNFLTHLSATKFKTKSLQLDDKKFSIHTAIPKLAESNQFTLKAIVQFLNILTYENDLILQLQKWK